MAFTDTPLNEPVAVEDTSIYRLRNLQSPISEVGVLLLLLLNPNVSIDFSFEQEKIVIETIKIRDGKNFFFIVNIERLHDIRK